MDKITSQGILQFMRKETFKHLLTLLMPCLVFFPLCALLFVNLAFAEGAVRQLDCISNKVCDGNGNCQAESKDRLFRMEPVKLESDGSGQYRMYYQDTESDMYAVTEAGPFFWQQGSQRNTLLVNSETSFLWHKLQMDPVPQTSIYYLNCLLVY